MFSAAFHLFSVSTQHLTISSLSVPTHHLPSLCVHPPSPLSLCPPTISPRRNDFKKLKGVDISALLNYDQTGLRSEKLIISKKFRRIRQTFYPNVEIYSQMTKDEMETKLRPEFEHIGSEFAAIFRSPNLKVQGIIKSEKFTAAFKRHFLSMIRGD
jgi:hypothetical protein